MGMILAVTGRARTTTKHVTTTGQRLSTGSDPQGTSEADVEVQLLNAPTAAQKIYPWLAWILFGLLFVGAGFCVTLVILDPDRKLSHGVVV